MKNVIRKYVLELSIDDLKNYIQKGNYSIPDKDIKTIYNYIKKYTDDILNGNEDCFKKFKEEVETNTYLEVMRLYNKYKKWI